MPASRARDAAARFAAIVHEDREVLRRQRAFASWCADFGLSPFPAHPRTVGLYLTAHVDVWAIGTLKNARHAIGRQHRVAQVPDPTHDPLVQRLWRSIAQAKKGDPRDLVEPLTAPLLAQICTDAASDRGPRAEAGVLRTQIAAVLGRRYRTAPSRLVQVGRGAVVFDGTRLLMEIPGVRGRSGSRGPSTEVVVEETDDPWDLVPKMRRYLDLVPEDPDAGPFCVRIVGDGRAFRAEKNAAALLSTQLRHAARRAGLRSSGATLEVLAAVDDDAFARLLAHCDRYHRIDLRNKAMVSASFSLALRPCEARGIRRGGVRACEEGFFLSVRRAKRPGCPPLDKVVHHWPGCPPHCPACLLAAWLAEVGPSLSAGALFPSKISGGVGKEMTDGAHKFLFKTMVERSEVSARLSPKAVRSGLITSMAEAGAETEEITNVSDHVTEDVVRHHYVLTNRVATHQLGRGPRGPSA